MTPMETFRGGARGRSALCGMPGPVCVLRSFGGGMDPGWLVSQLPHPSLLQLRREPQVSAHLVQQ